MIKLSGTPAIEGSSNDGKRYVRVSLWADSKDEMSGVTTGENIQGLNANDILTMGSTVLTAAEGNFGRLGSDGTWNF